MQELKVGDKAKHSDIYLRMLRGHHRDRAEKAVYQVTFVNDVSVKVIPFGSDLKFGTQFARRYVIPLEETRQVQMFCRYCHAATNKDMPGVVADYDNVTSELIGYNHEGCMPEESATV